MESSSRNEIIAFVEGMQDVADELKRSPHISRVIDNTALQAYMECPRKYLYSMQMNRRKEGVSSPPLSYGGAWHVALETHYKTGGDENAVLREVVMRWKPHDRPDDHRTVERVLAAYDEYKKKWGDHAQDCRDYGVTVGWPDAPLVECSTEISWPGALHPYAGKIDRIIEINGLYYVEDHKTSSRMGDRWSADWDPSNQMMGYVFLAQKLTGLKIQGVRMNFHACLKTQNKFDRAIVSFSQARIEEWALNYNAWIKRIERSSHMLAELQAGNYVLDEHVTAESILLDAFPHDWNACKGKYGMCGYRDVCTSPPRLRERILEADFADNPWDPMHAEDDDAAAE